MAHDDLKAKALQAINDVFGDTSVGPDKTRESLEELRDDIDTLLDSLPDE